MKHCPDPDCPHAISTGRPAEYHDDIDECADCKTPLLDGPAPAPSTDTERLLSIAKFTSPHEAHLARNALASHGIEAVVDQDHTPYVSVSSWVQLHVAQSDAELARQVLEQGPVLDGEEGAEADDAAPLTETEPAMVDDMRSSRLSRRMVLARWFLYLQAFGAFLWSFTIFGIPLLGLLYLIGAIVALGVALWSRQQPRPAFAVGLGFQTVVTIIAIARAGPLGLVAVVPHLAVYFAWAAAGKHPPEHLQAKPEAKRSAEMDIGEAWKEVAGPPELAPGLSFRWKRILAFVLVAAVVLVAGWLLMRSPAIQGLVRGTTGFSLTADTESALHQELELGRARLAHELRGGEIDFESIEISGSGWTATIEISGIRTSDSEGVDAILARLFPGWNIDTSPSGSLRVSPGVEVRAAIIDDALQETLAGLRTHLAVTVSRVYRHPTGTITVHARIPGSRSIDEIRELLERPARLEIKKVRYPDDDDETARWIPPPSRDEVIAMFGGHLPAGTEVVAQRKTPDVTLFWPVESVPIVVGRDLLDAYAATGTWGDPAITFRLNEEAGRRLEAATLRMLGRQMALILRDDDGPRVVLAPIIRGVISTEGVIEGGFTASEVQSLTKRMRAGARAMPLRVVETDAEPEP